MSRLVYFCLQIIEAFVSFRQAKNISRSFKKIVFNGMQDTEGEDMQPMGMHILSKKLVIYTSFKKIAFNETLDAEGEDMQPMGAHILSKKLLAPRLRVKWVNLGRFWGKQKK